MNYKDAISTVAENLGLPQKFVDKTYRAYWQVIREYIASQPLMDDLTDEEFSNLRPNVNIPSIGKLYVTLESYRKTKNRYKELTHK